MTDDKPAMEVPTNLTNSELMEKVLSTSAPLVNKTFLTAYGTTIRLTFGEESMNPKAGPAIRAAVGMSIVDVIALRDLLIRYAESLDIETVQETPENGEE
jgi:hypothetical protein